MSSAPQKTPAGIRSRRSLIHDCDPGQDDAIALMATLGSSAWNVVGVTVVGGNVRVEQCALNAGKILALCGKGEVPVHMGAPQPLRGTLVTQEGVFGRSGMAGADDLPVPQAGPSSTHAVDYLVKTLSSGGCFSVCATAPLTNLALALQGRPAIAAAIDRLVIMGGCVFPEPLRGALGNFPVKGTDGSAEYNFAMDPDAARIVFDSQIRDIGLVGLNVTHKVLFNSRWRDKLRSLSNPVAAKAADILSAVGPDDVLDHEAWRTTPDDPVRAVHDAVASIYLDSPGLFATRRMHIRIVTEPAPAVAGQSVPAEPGEAHASRFPVDVAVDCDPERVLSRMVEMLSVYR